MLSQRGIVRVQLQNSQHLSLPVRIWSNSDGSLRSPAIGQSRSWLVYKLGAAVGRIGA